MADEPMRRYLIRVDGALSPELAAAFPRLRVEVQMVQTVLTGPVEDSAELTGFINHLNSIGVEIVEVVRLPE